MKLLALTDIHGLTAPLNDLADAFATVDLVILAGDIRGYASIQEVLDCIKLHNPHIIAVPGNMDNPPAPQQLTEAGVNIHANHRIIDQVAFLGCGGALPFYGRFVFEEPELAQILAVASEGLPAETPKVLISHQPPYGTLNDQLDNGQHVGSHSVRQFIEEHQPLLCISGHIHRAIGIDSIGTTRIVNPGQPHNGAHVYAEIEHGTLTLLEIRHA